MTLEQLRISVAVAERQHVTRAAQALNLAQSAASAAIAALEARHGTRLFHGVGRRIELTEAGRVFLSDAKAVLARAGFRRAGMVELQSSFAHGAQNAFLHQIPYRILDRCDRKPSYKSFQRK
jgi:DNA-binding transcriptional LysR family regulator